MLGRRGTQISTCKDNFGPPCTVYINMSQLLSITLADRTKFLEILVSDRVRELSESVGECWQSEEGAICQIIDSCNSFVLTQSEQIMLTK